MLQPILHVLNSQKIILASGSPRRKEILTNIGLKFDVYSSSFEETLDKAGFAKPQDYALATAEHKVRDIVTHLTADKNDVDLIIGADTVVSLDGKIFEKPRDKENAFEILSLFSGRTHFVHTGVVLFAPTLEMPKSYEAIRRFSETTEVVMTTLSPAVIRSYIETGEPMDKAGGYGIQGLGGSLVRAIHGDYFNVMGFPLHSFCTHLVQIYTNKNPELLRLYENSDC